MSAGIKPGAVRIVYRARYHGNCESNREQGVKHA
jgi:hypothetical protein